MPQEHERQASAGLVWRKIEEAEAVWQVVIAQHCFDSAD